MELLREQAEVLKDKLTPMLGYLTRVRQRMEQLRIDDKLYHDVFQAQQSMQDLCADLHYRTCRGGVGRPR